MALPPQFDEPPLRAWFRLDGMIGRGQSRVLRVMWFMVPPGSVVWNIQFQALLASRFLSDIALQALLYGALIATARAGGGPVEAALLGTAYLLPGVLLGMYGGAVADALPKRVALAGAYFTMAVLCFLIPLAFGTSFRSLLLILFTVRILHLVSEPSEASTVPLVASKTELASATSFLSLASSAGEVVGKALLAPVLVRLFGVDPVVVIAGLLLALSATRVMPLDPPRHVYTEDDEELRRWSSWAVIRWLFREQMVLWMLLLAALGSTVGQVLGVLGPQYTSEVLHVDPANALYVFAPAPLGLVVALTVAPLAMHRFGERPVAIAGFAMVGAVMSALGLIGPLSDTLGGLPVIDIPGLSDRVELAASLSVVLGFGTTLAAASAQTFLSRTVPVAIQGRTFALLGVMKDGMAIPSLLALGTIASATGVAAVITVAPIFLVLLAFGFDRFASRFRDPPRRLLLAP